MPTTTIALMNPDSITIATDGQPNACFIHSLSDKYPVGVVVECDHDEFKGFQWADIVNTYRDIHGDQPKKMEEWASSFSEFLTENILGNKGERKVMFKRALLETFNYIVGSMYRFINWKTTACEMNEDELKLVLSEEECNSQFVKELKAWIDTNEHLVQKGKAVMRKYSYDNLLKECDGEIMAYLNHIFDSHGFSKEYISLFLSAYYGFYILEPYYHIIPGNINLHFFGWGQNKENQCDYLPLIYSSNVRSNMDSGKYCWTRTREVGFFSEYFSYITTTPYKIFHHLLYTSQWNQNDCVNQIKNKIVDVNRKLEYSKRYQRDLRRVLHWEGYKRNDMVKHVCPVKSHDWDLYNLHTSCSIKGQVKLLKEFMDIALSTLPEMENKMVEIAFIDYKKGYRHL